MSVSLENYRQLPKHAGIYQIGQYIGSSINIRNRVRGHLKKLRAGKHTSALMQKAYDDEFSCIRVRVLEFVPARKRVNLVIREQHYFDLLKPKWNNTLFAHAPMQDPKIAARQSKSMKVRFWT